MKHDEAHTLAGQTVAADIRGVGSVEYVVEDWWDRVAGKSWMHCDGNPACMEYAIRSGIADLPTDDNVLYGKVGSYGHLIHVSELRVASEPPA